MAFLENTNFTSSLEEPDNIFECFFCQYSLIIYLVFNKELAEAKEVSLTASLEEADDLIIADTTRITLDYR